MKNKNYLTRPIWLLTAIFAFATQFAIAQNIREHSNFDEISYSISGDLIIEQSDNFSVKLVGSDNDLDKIVTKVEGNTLIIKSKNNSSIKGDVKVYVSLPQLRELSIAGSGNVISEKPFTVDKLEIALSGSGDITFKQLKASRLETSIAGSGDLFFSGSVSEVFETSIAGSGDINAVELKAKNVEVNIAGSGSAHVFASDKLETSIVGSGSVRYKGDALVNASSIGSGTTRKL